MKIVFWNCGGTGNLGDDLMDLGVVEKYKACYDSFEHMRIFRLNESTIKKVNEADLLVIGGGRILDGSDFMSALVKYEVKTPYVFEGVEVRAFIDVEAYHGKVTPEKWVVRNKISVDMLRQCGFGPILLEKDLSNFVNIDFEMVTKKMGGINLKNLGKDRNFLRDLRVGLPKDATLVSFNTTHRHKAVVDGEICEISDCDDTGMMAEISDGREVMGYRGGYTDPLKFAGRLGRFSWMICERLHACILANRMKIDYLAVNSDEKVRRFMTEIGQKQRLIDHDPASIIEGAKFLNA